MFECKKSPNLFFKIHQNNDVQNKDIFIAISVIFIACKSYLEWLMNISSSGRQYWLKKNGKITQATEANQLFIFPEMCFFRNWMQGFILHKCPDVEDILLLKIG